MKRNRNALALMLVLSLLAVVSGKVSAATVFPDVKETAPCYEAVKTLYEYGVVNGYPDGSFRPDEPITRAELVKMVNLVFDYQYSGTINPFKDVESGFWYYREVLTAVEREYILGFPDGTFRGNVNVTREQVCVIIDRNVNLVLLPFDKTISDAVSPWARDSVEKFASNYIWMLESGNRFRATANATRGEVAIALARFCFDDGPIPEDSLNTVMSRVIRQLQCSLESGALASCNQAQEEIIQMVIINMAAYLADSNHDYQSAADATMVAYHALTVEDRENLREWILYSCGSEDLIRLQEYFFPDMSY